MFYQKKDLLEKAATMKKFEYSPLEKESKAQTNITKKHYQKLDRTFDFDRIIKKEKSTLKKYNRSSLIYDSKYIFYAYHNIRNFNYLSQKSSISILFSFLSKLNNFNNINPQKWRTKEKNRLCIIMHPNYIMSIQKSILINTWLFRY